MKSYLKNMAVRLNRTIDFFRRDIIIARNSYISPDCVIGNGTRVNAQSYIDSCNIGRYCAIAGRLTVRSSNHFTNRLNMQGHLQYSILNSQVKVTGKSKNTIKIGDGVWIGDSVIILPDVEISDGAVIGAGSVVTKSIPAYAIAVGNPAKVIKYRFNKDVIEVLLKEKPFKKDLSKIKEMKKLFELDLDFVNGDELERMFNEY